MKYYLLRFAFSIAMLVRYETNAQSPLKPIEDGPYMFYRGDSILVKSIRQINGHAEPFIRRLSSGGTIDIQFAGHADWNFTVPLKKEIIPERPINNSAIQKAFIVSDIEGEFGAFRDLLLAAKVTDRKYHWLFGSGQLIIAGDLFDRGRQVAQFLWLLYKLEDEARNAGGSVHVILGNHDIMNLSGDYRYVDPVYFSNAGLLREIYANLYDKNTELGRWLRSKNLIEKIGDLLVLHGGISAPVNALDVDLETLNNTARHYYSIAQRKDSIPEKWLPLFATNTSPFWYRGYFMMPRARMSQIDSTLALYHCNKIVVGHTILDRNIAFYYDGKLLAVDVDEHTGKHEGGLLMGGRWYVVDSTGKRKVLDYLPTNDIIHDSDIR